MSDTGEDREIKQRTEAKDAETFRESKQLAAKTKAADLRKLKGKAPRGPKVHRPKFRFKTG